MKRIDVYRNLNKPGITYSVRQGGRVQRYTSLIAITDCRFKHATPKQLSEVRTGARQVCQWIGGIECAVPASLDGMRRLCCDPKKADGFVDAETGDKVMSASMVVLTEHGTYYS